MDVAEAGTITILFTDLVGSTELSVSVGDSVMDEIRRRHFADLRQALDATGGVEVKTVGDALMASYRSTADAVASAVLMQQAVARSNRRPEAVGLAMRVGVSVGDATFEDGDWFGTPVVEASRLCAAADGGQILVADVVRVLSGNRGGNTFDSAGVLDLKGLSNPLPACEVAWDEVVEGPVPLPPAIGATPRTRLVQRQIEVDAIRAAWAGARAGERAVSLISGDPGVGKTRLAAEMARHSYGEGAVVLFGRCDEELTAPFRPFVDAVGPLVKADAAAVDAGGPSLTRVFPELEPVVGGAPVADSDTERLWMFEAVDRMLSVASRSAPVLVVLDDLHWADRPSLQLLRHLVRSTEPAALMILGTYRETDLSRSHPLAELLADLRRDRAASRLSLGGLDADATSEMIGAWGGAEADPALAAAVHAETDGNPFFVEEVLAHLAESELIEVCDGRLVSRAATTDVGIPEGVREVVGRRLSRLGSDANAILTCASAIGREWDLEVTRRVADIERTAALDAAEEAARAGLIVEVPPGSRFAFSHALVRSTLYDELSITRRVRLHGRIGHAFEAMYGDHLDAHLPELAQHFSNAAAAGEAERAVDYAIGAGRQATAKLAFEDGVAFYDLALQALDFLEPPNDVIQYQVLIERAPLLHSVGRHDDETDSARQAAEIAQAHGWGDELAVAVMRIGNVPGTHVDPMVLAWVTEAQDLLPADALARRAELLSFRASYASLHPFGNPDSDRREELAAAAVAIAREVGDPAVIANALLGRYHTIRNAGANDELLAIADEIEAQFRAAGRDYDALEGASRRLRPLLALGRRDEWDRALERFDDPTYTGTGWKQGNARLRSMIALAEGRLDDASEYLGNEQARLSEVGRNAQFDLALAIRWARGDTDGTLRQVAAGIRVAADDFPALRTQHIAYLAALGRDDEARSALAAITDVEAFLVARDDNRMFRDLAEAAVRLRDADLAARLLPRVAAFDGTILTSYDLNTCDGAAAITIAHCETVLGDFDAAEAHYQAGIALEKAIRARGLLPNSWIFYARMLKSRDGPGDAERAEALLADAHDAAQRMGMHHVAAQASAHR
jgi:class 3 adenylate cyclase